MSTARRRARCCDDRRAHAPSARPPDPRDARLRRRHRQRGARHPARAARAPAIESEIIVETADPRLEDLTVDYRDMVERGRRGRPADPSFLARIARSRTAFALPCRMMLIYHNITPPEYFLGVHEQLVRQCYHGRRELLPYRSRCELALGDSEFNRQELEALGFSATRRCCRSCRTSRTSTSRPTPACSTRTTTTGRTSCSSAG